MDQQLIDHRHKRVTACVSARGGQLEHTLYGRTRSRDKELTAVYKFCKICILSIAYNVRKEYLFQGLTF